MGLFDGNGGDMFGLDRNSLILASLAQAAAQTAMPTRTPIPTGAVLGNLAGGLAGGAKDFYGLEKEKLESDLLREKIPAMQQMTKGRAAFLADFPQFLERLRSGQGVASSAKAPMIPSVGSTPGSLAPSSDTGMSIGGMPDRIVANQKASAYEPLIRDAALSKGLSPNILSNLIGAESGFRPNEVSPKGAAGIAQFMPGTAKRFGIDPFDPTQAIPAAADYVAKNREMFRGNLGLALAGYNWGEGNVKKWLNKGADPGKMPDETRKYVSKITGQPIETWVQGGGSFGSLSPQQTQSVQMAQNSPVAAPQGAVSPGALAPPISGAAPRTGVDPYELAARGSMAQLFGLGDVMKPLENAYYQSPEHKAQLERATKQVGLDFLQPEERVKANEAARLDELRRRNELLYAPQIAGASTDATEQAKTRNLAAQEKIKTDEAIRQANETFDSKEKNYRAYVGEMNEKGLPFKGRAEFWTEQARSAAMNIQQKIEGQGAQAAINHGFKQLEDTGTVADAATKRQAIYGQMAQAMEGFQPGATAEKLLSAKRLLRDVGAISGEDVPAAEAFKRAQRHLAVMLAPKGQGAISNYERELVAEVYPQLTDTPESIMQAIAIGMRLDDFDRKVHQVHLDVAQANGGLPNPIEARQRIMDLGPPLSPEEYAAIDRAKSKAQARQDANPVNQQNQAGGGGASLPRMKTPEEALKLPPGTPFIDANGVSRVRP